MRQAAATNFCCEAMNTAWRVFLSYAREDADAARRLQRDLKELAIDVWFDKDSLLPGQKWRREIKVAIRAADFFVFVLSKNSVTKRGMVQREVKEALEVMQEISDDARFIIPARIEPVEPAHDVLRDIQWVDLFDDWSEGVRRIGLAIVGHTPAPSPSERSDVLSLVKCVAEAMTASYPKVAINLTASVVNSPIIAVPAEMELVIRELIANAVMHAAPDASSGIAVGVSINTTASSVIVEVTNPVRPLDGDALTNVFYRSVTNPPRAGAGLYFARGVIQRYAGELAVKWETESPQFTATTGSANSGHQNETGLRGFM